MKICTFAIHKPKQCRKQHRYKVMDRGTAAVCQTTDPKTMDLERLKTPEIENRPSSVAIWSSATKRVR